MKIRNIALFIIILCLGSCVNEPYWPDTEESGGVRYSLFDFCSTFDCDVTLSLGKNEFVYIYTVDPEQNPHAEAVRTLWTDSNGAFNCTLILPTALIGKQIYAVSSSGTFKANVTEKGASFKSASSRDGETTVHGILHPQISVCQELKDSYLERMGRYTDNLSKLVETGEIAIHTKDDNTQVLFTYLHSFGWNSNAIYYYYYKGEDPITAANKDKYIDKICNDPEGRFLCTKGWGIQVNNGKITDNDDPEQDDVTILTSSGNGAINLRFSDIQGNAKGSVEEISEWKPSKYVEKHLDNKQIESMIGISNHLYFYGDFDLSTTKYKYDYKDEMSFPAGYKIGLILKSVKHTDRRDVANAAEGNVNYFFTNPKLNEVDTKRNNSIHVGRFWTSEEAKNISRFVYGFEDSYNDNYNFTDFLCMVSTDPIAYTADAASLSSTYSAVSGTLLFEDMFPEQGDYDMNDVIVEYRKVKEFEKGTKIKDDVPRIKNFYIELTPVHCGAEYDDYLYVYDPDKDYVMTPELVDFQAKFGMSLKNVAKYNEQQLLSNNPQNLKTLRYDIVKDWKLTQIQNGKTREVAWTDNEIKFENLEVFLYVKNTDREVHLTGKTWKRVGLPNTDLDEPLQQYHAPQQSDGAFLPWAMDIPIKSDAHGYRGFIPVTEKVRITEEYLSFLDWVNGDKTKAWYENKYHTPKGK